MESQSDPSKDPGDKRTARTVNASSSAEQTQRKKLGSILNFEKHERSYDDIHPKVLKNLHQKQPVERKSRKSEELVKYMSNLPSYLEKGENRQDKAFNIGVLDWRLLEKWQHSSLQKFPETKVQEFRTDGIISSSRGKNRIRHGKDQEEIEVQSSATDHDLFERHKTTKSGSTNCPENRCSVKSHSSYSSKGDNHRYLEDHRYSFFGESSATVNHTNFTSFPNESGKTKDSQVDKCCSEETKSINSPSEIKKRTPLTQYEFSQLKMGIAESTKGNGSVPVSPSRRKKLKEKASGSSPSNLAEDDFSRLDMDISESTEANGSISINPYRRENLKEKNSESLPRNLAGDGVSQSKMGISVSTEINGSTSVSPSKGKNMKEKNSDSLPRKLAEDGFCRSKMGMSESATVRNPSPTRRFSFSIGRRGKSSSSAVTSAEPFPVSENPTGAKLASSSECVSASTCDKSNATSRARSSPLRRLLDPFLKSKGGESHQFDKSLKKNPSTINISRELPPSNSVKVKLDLKGCRTADIGGLRESERSRSPTMQALLQVTVKNGLPLFTFTVDSCGDILAATVKEITSPKKAVHRWVYTFFSFSEMKKKSMNWINQGCKDRTHGFISNVIAQMKVCDVPCTDSNRQRSVTRSITREFVLSSMGTNDGDQILDALPSDELAAIVVKFSEKICQDFKEPLQGERQGSVSKGDFTSMTVILPGGDHGVPRKGDPSPLIKRWKTGGSCDCGGWDLGCQLRVLASGNQSSLRSNPTKPKESTFKLFSEEEAEQNKPAFVLSPFEEEIFSVEFSSSLKLIQAFAIGIGILNSKTKVALPPSVIGGKISEEITLPKETAPRITVEVPGKYDSYPPHSPVGRV